MTSEYTHGCHLVIELFSLDGEFITVLVDDTYAQPAGAVGVYIMKCSRHERQGLRLQARLYKLWPTKISRLAQARASQESIKLAPEIIPFVYLTHDHINDGPVCRTTVDKHGVMRRVGPMAGYVPPMHKEHS